MNQDQGAHPGITELYDDVALAIDIGGTKMSVGLIDRSGYLRHKASIPTPRDDANALLHNLTTLVKSRLRRSQGRTVGLGVSVAGVINVTTGDILWCPNIPCLRDFPLGEILHDATNLTVVVGFDGQLAALGENWVGAGQAVRNMALLIIGTGIGGGLILDGQLYRGRDTLAGAAGWMVVDPDTMGTGDSRAVGNLESIASGPAIASAAERLLADGHISMLESPITPEAIVEGASEGDDVALAVLQRAGRGLGLAVVSIVSLLNVEAVLLGGGLGSTGVFLEAVRGAVDSFAQPVSRSGVRVGTALLGNDAGLVGAGRLVFQQEDSRAICTRQPFNGNLS